MTRAPWLRKRPLNARNLEALGVERLAQLLMELSTGDGGMKRRLRMELAGAESPAKLAGEIRKRLASIVRSRSFIDWHGVRTVASDLEVQRRAIVEQMAKSDPGEDLELLWRFMALATSIFERSDDGSGTLIGIFHLACEDIGELAVRSKTDPIELADRVNEALIENDYGQYDGLIGIAAPALGASGLEHLKQRMTDSSNQAIKRPADQDRVEIGWSSSGPIYEDEMAERSRRSTVSLALQEIADAQGDVDAFIDQYDEKTRKVPRIAAEIGRRLLAASRADEALATIDAAEQRRKPDGWQSLDFAWENARIDALEALGRADEAQQVRWSCFERSLFRFSSPGVFEEAS